MSISKEQYQARLTALREAYNELRNLERISKGTKDYCVEDKMYRQGVTHGFKNSADMVLLYIKGVQYRLRRICGVGRR